MKLYKLKWTVPKGEDGDHLTAIGDVHKGNRYHDQDPYKINMEWLYKHKEQKILTMGDLIECSTKNSVGLYDQIMPVQDQMEEIIKEFQPFADEGRLIGMIQGNHENRALKDASIDVTRTIANYFGVRYLGTSGTFYIKVKNEGSHRGQNYVIYARHGKSGARTAGGRINAILRMRDIVRADLYLQGHVHTLDHNVMDIIEIDRGTLRLRRRHFVITGSYMKYGGYVEEAGYPPAGPSGSARIKFHSDEHRITVKI